VLGIIIINAFIGRKVGLVKMLFSLFSFLVAILLTVWISPTINGMLKNNETFYDSTSDKVEDMLSLEERDESNQEGLIEQLPLPRSIKETLQENKAKQEENIKSYIIGQVTGIVINALAFIITFVVVFVGLWIVGLSLRILSKLPILNSINRTAGLLVGGLQGLIVVWILFIVLTIFSSSDIGKSAFLQIEGSGILSYIYNKNLFLNIVMSAVKLF
jgi:uncharacterized membrane protein required for colicin V production